ncbi:hypothetical protein ASG89_01220 [Paenibacillus sp. Soil766]|uniref:stalk domain-containing protein n=1 Tax=Paenibacillus sp. Soil766 TaxID=1736404 RepID=UPI000708B165|nr:stalk domain-containing protein [Paenibacillus sp. Soil766]KRF10188.1 hypothetical protein ASG89_01220 [Paenibacillus sp. Soil766]
MKRFILGLICGMGLTATTTVFASDTIQAYLFPVKYEFNGQIKQLDSDYTTLNYNGHAYVPVRFVAESLGVGVRYINSITEGKVISIKNGPTNVDETTKKVWDIQYRLNLGQDEKYVKELLGQPVVERTNDDHQLAAWRYDISPTSGYKYQGLTIDFNGLEQDSIGAQLIVYWSNEGKVEKIELGYKHPKSGKVVMHNVFPDGSTSEAIVE